MQFWGFSVLHCHGVFPSRDQQQQQKPLQQQEEKAAKIHSSSKKKKQPESSFSVGFKVTLTIFGVQFWGFSVLQFWGFSVLHCHGVFPSGDQQQQQQKPLQQQENVAMVFSHPGTSSSSKSLCSSGRKR